MSNLKDDSSTTLDAGRIGAALAYQRRGWAPIPIASRSKKADYQVWQKSNFSEAEIPYKFVGVGNIGILLGANSGNLVDVDLDVAEAVKLARAFLPKTATFGHRTNPDSHWIYYVAPLPETRKFADPSTADEAMLVEFRSTGAQTVFPPSCHSDTGEPITWGDDQEPVMADGDSLLRSVARLAAAVLVARHWPEGNRHHAALSLAGALLRDGHSPEDVEFFARHAAIAAGDNEVEDRVNAVRTTVASLKEGREVTGWPRLSEIIGDSIVIRVRDWVGAKLPSTASTSLLPSPGDSWEKLAERLDEIRVGIDIIGEKKIRRPRHIVQERILNFIVEALRQRGRFFFDAYPFVFLDGEAKVIRLSNEDHAYQLLSQLRLRAEQPDARFAHSNLELHILSQGEAVRVEQLGCWRDDAIFVNNGRGGMFKITADSIAEVKNGTDLVFMLSSAEFKRPWPTLTRRCQERD
jgi:hypothetical protein